MCYQCTLLTPCIFRTSISCSILYCQDHTILYKHFIVLKFFLFEFFLFYKHLILYNTIFLPSTELSWVATCGTMGEAINRMTSMITASV